MLELPAIANEGTDHEQALWPEWYDLGKLREIRKVLPPRDWTALYQQSPRREQGTYMQRSWFATRWAAADAAKDSQKALPEHLNIYMASDFGVTEARDGRDPDSTEHGVFGVDHEDNLYVLDWWHGQTTPDAWINSLLDLQAKHRPLCWFGEGGVIRRAVEPFFSKRVRERRIYARCEWLSPIHDKATRGRAFQARSSMGKVIFPANAPWAERVVEQCVAFPGAKHDDAFDVLSMMCQAIDQAHPAIMRKTKKPRPRDRWRRADDRQQVERWKVI